LQSLLEGRCVCIAIAEHLPDVLNCTFACLVGKKYPATRLLGRTRATALTHDLFQVKILDRPKVSQIDAILPAREMSRYDPDTISFGHD